MIYKYKSKRELSLLTIVLLTLFFIACNKSIEKSNSSSQTETNDSLVTIEKEVTLSHTKKRQSLSPYEQMLDSLGLVDIQKYDSTIFVDLKYSSINNILGEDMYGDLEKCYVEKETAKKLSIAQIALKKIDPGLSLVLFDGVRPRSIQRKMWDEVDIDQADKKKFLAKPDRLSLHNFGAAVDVSIKLKDGSYLDMGTEFDHPGELAYPILEEYFLEKGILGMNQVQNRKLLREIMIDAGFIDNKYEWWHFSSMKRDVAIQNLSIIESFTTFSKAGSESLKDSEKQTVVFKVQIATSLQKLSKNSKVLKGYDAEEYYHEGLYKYTKGSFTNLKETYEYRDSLKKCCFSQAFVVCFNNNERIQIQEAIKLIE